MAITQIDSIDALKQYALRRLGSPVINIEIADVQMNDRIDEAIQKWVSRHYNGTTEVWEAVVFTESDAAKQSVKLKDDWAAVLEIIDPAQSDGMSGDEFDNLNFLISNSEILNGINISATNYVLTMEHIATLKRIFTPERSFTYNSVTHQLKPKGIIKAGNYIILHGYKSVDPEMYGDAYNEDWVKKYVTALFKLQWGNNLKKYDGVQIPGGVVMNGQRIYDEAVQEVADLEQSLEDKYTLPIDFYFE